MWKLPDPRFDVASALDQGSRDYQEDSLVTDFPIGDDCGIVVLADGMGGHSAGDVASNLIVTEVFGDLKFQRSVFFEQEEELPEILVEAAAAANQTLGEHVQEYPESTGMGTTLLAAVMVGSRFYWTSVGDSPLYLIRNGELRQLNQDHSMAPQIDVMAQTGIISAEEAATHPDRNCLTSAIYGGRIDKIDAPSDCFQLRAGDVVLVASDGIQYLKDCVIERIVGKNRRKSAADIAGTLLRELKRLNHPEQDNISFAVIKVNHDKALQRNERPEHTENDGLSVSATRLANDDLLLAPFEAVGEAALELAADQEIETGCAQFIRYQRAVGD